MYNLALAYEQGRGVRKNLRRAMELYAQAAELGDVDAQLALGWAFLNGMVDPPDYMSAFRWYRQAAKQGSASALFSLGQMFMEGLGVPCSRGRAARYFRAAAAAGHAKATELLRDLE
jgi:TPR repeat protein